MLGVIPGLEGATDIADAPREFRDANALFSARGF